MAYATCTDDDDGYNGFWPERFTDVDKELYESSRQPYRSYYCEQHKLCFHNLYECECPIHWKKAYECDRGLITSRQSPPYFRDISGNIIKMDSTVPNLSTIPDLSASSTNDKPIVRDVEQRVKGLYDLWKQADGTTLMADTILTDIFLNDDVKCNKKTSEEQCYYNYYMYRILNEMSLIDLEELAAKYKSNVSVQNVFIKRVHNDTNKDTH